ncbi:uncharacterized protein A4U43_C09F11220 [Asparagus officinalis]|uniref:Uncharacterized protein n=1 Tax=Asparagus officinalis TaxID=4686 RepID=A0A5P1E6S0_ASPOF|nr:uncharacterized protein A4U43_C09F11220 [Asparagus officinalis]
MGELAAKLGIGRRSKKLSIRCHGPIIVAQIFGLTRADPPLEQHLSEEQSVVQASEIETIADTITGTVDPAPQLVLSSRPGKEPTGLAGESASQAPLSSEPQAEETTEYYNVSEEEGGAWPFPH